jgi:hypothetical protein
MPDDSDSPGSIPDRRTIAPGFLTVSPSPHGHPLRNFAFPDNNRRIGPVFADGLYAQ